MLLIFHLLAFFVCILRNYSNILLQKAGWYIELLSYKWFEVLVNDHKERCEHLRKLYSLWFFIFVQ